MMNALENMGTQTHGDIAQKFLFDNETDVENGQFVVDDDNWSEERGRVGGLCVGDSFTTALVESSILILTMQW